MDEQDLVARLLNKEKAALDYLYERYAGALYGVIKRILQKDEQAEELLQDAFLKIWNKIENYDAAKGRLFTWMLNVTRNLAIDKTRSREISNESKTAGLENLVSKVDSRESVEQPVEIIGVAESLSSLPEDQRFVVEYLYWRGYTQSELAEEFNIPLGTVKTRLRLAMIQLRIFYQVS
jgi:RNA polymerase sigma-70 factor (ECF subfamily)